MNIFQCTFEMLPERPKLVISDGPERSVEAYQTFEVSARESVDMNVAPGKAGNLSFLWSCETISTTVVRPDFCKMNLGKSKYRGGNDFHREDKRRCVLLL